MGSCDSFIAACANSITLLPVLEANTSNSLPNSRLFLITTSCAALPLKPCCIAVFVCCAVNTAISSKFIPRLPTSAVANLTLFTKLPNCIAPSVALFPKLAKPPPLSPNAFVKVVILTPADLAATAKSNVLPATPRFKPSPSALP